MNLANDNSTIKFLLYILLFLVMILLLLIIFIIPNIKTYKTNRSELATFVQKNRKLSVKKIELNQKIEKYKIENKRLNSRFDNKFDKEDFIKFASKYLNGVKVTKNKSTKIDYFDDFNLTAVTPTKSPKNFYKFIDSLKEYKNVIKMNFPILMKSNRSNIELKFNIGVYKNIKK